MTRARIIGVGPNLVTKQFAKLLHWPLRRWAILAVFAVPITEPIVAADSRVPQDHAASARLERVSTRHPRASLGAPSRQHRPGVSRQVGAGGPMVELERFRRRVDAYARRRADGLAVAFSQALAQAAGERRGQGGATADPLAARMRPAGVLPARTQDARLLHIAHRQAERVEEGFFRGRYDRSRARLPENVALWRERPDIANPGPDLANFPNSAFTLPAGRAYIEMSPVTYYGTAQNTPAQFNTEFLLRYGVTDDIEFRIFGNGASWSGGPEPTWGFSPIALDTKIQLWTEKPALYLPAAGLEAYLQTQWLGSRAFNGGTQPSVTFNFDQSLPFGIDLEYNVGATRVQDWNGQNVWEASFQWALQRDLFDEDFAVFVHGFFNAMTLPRLPNIRAPLGPPGKVEQNAVGAGFIWTVDRRVAVYGQLSGGTTAATPSTIGMLGFAAAF